MRPVDFVSACANRICDGDMSCASSTTVRSYVSRARPRRTGRYTMSSKSMHGVRDSGVARPAVLSQARRMHSVAAEQTRCKVQPARSMAWSGQCPNSSARSAIELRSSLANFASTPMNGEMPLATDVSAATMVTASSMADSPPQTVRAIRTPRALSRSQRHARTMTPNPAP